MSVLTKERLTGYGPFVNFIERLPGGKTRHIAAWADSLLEVYCSITNQYLPFDPHLGGEMDALMMRKLANELFHWCTYLSNCRLDLDDVSPLLELYIVDPPVERDVYEAALEALRIDLIETASTLALDVLRVSIGEGILEIEGL